MPRIVDRVFLMAYDEHETIGRARADRVAAWFARAVADAARGVPRVEAGRRDRQLRL